MASVAERLNVSISHTRADSEGQLFLSHGLNRHESHFRPLFYSIDPNPPPASAIRESILRCEALFLLLSDQMLDAKNSEHADHTRARAGYEVGVVS